MVFFGMDIPKEISKIPFWHQKIDLGYGFIAPGAQDTDSLLQQISLPEDLIDTSWVESFRGGLSATKMQLESNHPRFIDTAKSVAQPINGWDVNTIISVGEI